MNCKHGELAVIVRSYAGNEGKIVRCLRLASEEEMRHACFPLSWGPAWVLDRMIPTMRGNKAPLAFDAFLRPIRPGEGEDETIQWAGKPEQVTA